MPVVEAVKSTAVLPGSICGHRCVSSPAPASSFVSGSGVPPAEETRKSPERVLGVKTIDPSSPHDPPRSSSTSQIVRGAPPLTEIFLSFPSAKNPFHSQTEEKNAS